MAFIFQAATRIRTRTPHLLFPFRLYPPAPVPCSTPHLSPPTRSYSSSTPKTDIQKHPFFIPESSLNQHLYESSDYESDEIQPSDSLPDPSLDGFLRILFQARKLSSDEDSMALLEASGIRPTSCLINEAMRAVRSDWELAFLAFKWGERCGCSSVGIWNLMVWILGKQRRFDRAWKLVRDMHRSAMSTRQALLIMIKRYAAANDASKAIRTFQAMDKFKLTADSTAFYTLLCALCKHKNIEEAEELMFLNRKLFPLETESFNIILNGWCNIIIDTVEAKRVWREMSNCCITTDGTSYTHMICCFSKVGNLFDSLRLYDEMKKRGWIPGLVVYNSLIYVLMKENCIKEAHNILHKIIDVGIKPDVATYNSFIYPLCEAKKLEEARNMLNKMVEKGLDPTIETYHAFAKVENMVGTSNLINRMREVGCGPTHSTFLIVLDKFFRWFQPENALRMWHEMCDHNLIPNSEHYTVLVQGLATCGLLHKARDFYGEMTTRGFPNDPKLEKILRKPSPSAKFCRKQEERHSKGDIHAVRGKGKMLGKKVKKVDSMLNLFKG